MRSHESDDRPAGLPPDVVEDLLADPRRRHLLAELGAAGEELPVADVATAVLARERDVPPDTIATTDRRAVERTILQTHLPKLTATGVVAYDSMLATVELLDPELLTALEDRTGRPER